MPKIVKFVHSSTGSLGSFIKVANCFSTAASEVSHLIVAELLTVRSLPSGKRVLSLVSRVTVCLFFASQIERARSESAVTIMLAAISSRAPCLSPQFL